ncbi:MAG: hypothetical protein U0163_20470 [Gemmatimonadaceae bacterium]
MTISDPLERQPQGWALVWPATAALAVASIARVGAAAVRGAWLHEFTWSPTDLPWMTLVGNAIIFSGVALVLWILTRRMARTTAFAVAMAVIGFLLMLSIMLLITEIWQYASLLLSAGVAWRIRIATGRRPDVMQRLARRIAVVALPLALLLAARSAWTGAREPSESTAAADAQGDAGHHPRHGPRLEHESVRILAANDAGLGHWPARRSSSIGPWPPRRGPCHPIVRSLPGSMRSARRAAGRHRSTHVRPRSPRC